ncbi:hypothetical protein ACIQPQ_30985 [Streptomyces sp. NPDC091281]|uniref:hypothetical protein n=1 Tax=Streptomyces sp. NPDC091281 TaxID=3365985 RepID=UPI003802AABD
MTEPRPGVSQDAIFRCSLDVGGERVTAHRQVARMLLMAHPEARDHVERELRLELAQEIVKKLDPPVEEVDWCGREVDRGVSRDEALRLATTQAQALSRLASQLEEAGENYALPDAWQARDAALALVAKLEGDDGRLPTDPRFWAARRR